MTFFGKILWAVASFPGLDAYRRDDGRTVLFVRRTGRTIAVG